MIVILPSHIYLFLSSVFGLSLIRSFTGHSFPFPLSSLFPFFLRSFIHSSHFLFNTKLWTEAHAPTPRYGHFPPLIDPTAIPCRWAPIRTKQLSMATTAGVIRLYASVRYWPYRGVGTFASVHNSVSFSLPLDIALYIHLCIDIQFGKKLITIQRHCNFFSIGWLFKSKVCYDKYGCFDRHPNILVRFPQEPSKLGTSFLLFTRKNSQTAKIIDDSDVNKLRDSFFEISRRTIFLIHGFTGKIQLLLILTLIKLNIYY